MGDGIYLEAAARRGLSELYAAGFIAEATVVEDLLDHCETLPNVTPVAGGTCAIDWLPTPKGPALRVTGPQVTVLCLVRPLDQARCDEQGARGEPVDERGPPASPDDWFTPAHPGVDDDEMNVDVWNTEVRRIRAAP